MALPNKFELSKREKDRQKKAIMSYYILFPEKLINFHGM